MKHVRYRHGDMFDEADLFRDGDPAFPLIGKRSDIETRPMLRNPSRQRKRRDRIDHGKKFRRRVREKAWGMPY